MAISTSAGARLFIGPSANPDTIRALSKAAALAAFEAVIGGDWTEVLEVETIDRLGDTTEAATFTSLADRRTRTVKTTYNGGTTQITCGRDPLDDGQIALTDALATDLYYRFKIEYNDARDENYSISTDYWAGQVMSGDTTIGSVTDITKVAFAITNNTGVFSDPTDPTGS